MPADASARMNGEKTIPAQLDELFTSWNRDDAPGLIVGVAKSGQLIYRRAFGMASLETCVANTPKTRMRIGSTTKHFTSLLALLLAEEGKLNIDSPIRNYLPEMVNVGGDPTLRQLMQHTGGSRCYLDLAFVVNGPDGMLRRGDALKIQARQHGRNFAPGEAMTYNNGGYHLLSLAIERAGGQAFADQLRTRFFEPLGMIDTALVSSDVEITPGIATLHMQVEGGRWRRGLFNAESKGEGGIVSTVDDMLRWAAHLRSRDRFGTPATWKTLRALPTFADGSHGIYALGLMVDTYRGLKVVHHGGTVMGGSSQMLSVTDFELDIVILANGAPGAAPAKLTEQIIDIILAGHVGEKDPAVLAKDHSALIGDWWSPKTEMLYSLIDHEGELRCKLGNVPAPYILKRGADGMPVMAAHAHGEVRFRETKDRDELEIGFCGSWAIYQRVSRGYGALAPFAKSVSGSYYAHDADARAEIRVDGERTTMRLSGAHGYVDVLITPLAENVAVTDPHASEFGGWSALTFDKNEGVATSFRLNNWRTRNLEFVRAQSPDRSGKN